MTFEEILTQAIAMLQRQGRVAHRALTRQFDLEADYLEDLKEAILYAHPQHVVLLSGEAGIGKSRLVRVLREHIASTPHVRWEWRSSPYHQHTALYPMSDFFQHTLSWQPEDAAGETLTKLEQVLRSYRLPLEKAVPLFATLLSLSLPAGRYAPLTLSPQRQRQKTLETIVAMLLELAERQPVLCVVEDLHWADSTTLALLDLLIEQIPTAPICTLLTCRPTFQPPWSQRSYLTQLTLGRLSRPQVAQMVVSVTDSPSPLRGRGGACRCRHDWDLLRGP